MNKLYLLLVLTLFVVGCTSSPQQTVDTTTAETPKEADTTATVTAPEPEPAPSEPLGVQALMKAYPELIDRYENNHIVFKDGSKMTYDDGVKKDFVQTLDNSDIEDMFSLEYTTSGTPGYLADAGRSRCDALFKKMYGNSASQVEKQMVKVDWFGSKLPFASVNHACDSLRAVATEIASRYPNLVDYMKPGMTFYWRKVRGANRQSAHSYGIAIDINVAKSDYWLWAYPQASETDRINHKNRIPMEIVKVFEKHGFIWGGRWYHFDTMHFEYRPEILAYKRLHK